MTLVAIFSIIAAILLIWAEDKTTCGVTTKVFETMFILIGFIAYNEYKNINVKL
ncbi:MAG: hypothetical protein IJG68_01645 [Bacilli bacterium]|nr:hypothetical protein [Bacilli bacterium]